MHTVLISRQVCIPPHKTYAFNSSRYDKVVRPVPGQNQEELYIRIYKYVEICTYIL